MSDGFDQYILGSYYIGFVVPLADRLNNSRHQIWPWSQHHDPLQAPRLVATLCTEAMMSYLPGFSNDIFISFAHTDNLNGWVERFQEHLSIRLAQLDAPVTIWRDSKLRGTDDFSDEIFEQLKRTAILVSIVSPTGIRSRWCQEEREKFEQFAALNGGFRVGNIIRAVKVVKTPLDHDAHRPLFDTLGFEFYEREGQTDRFEEFDLTSSQFRGKLDDLAQDIKRALGAVRSLGVPGAEKLNVYVAGTSTDLEESRQTIVRQIQDWGYNVLPGGSLPPESSSFHSLVNPALDGSVLSVHLLGSQRGFIPDGEEKSIISLQYELAQARLMDRILWIQPGSQPHASVLSSIEQGSQQGVERVEDRSLEYLKEVVEAKLKRLRREAPLLKEGSDKINVYLVCHPNDNPYADGNPSRDRLLKLKSYLDSKGMIVWLPPVNVKEEKERRKDHRATLNFSDAVVLYWGEADEVWFRENLRELITARARRSSRRHLAEAIYFSAPPLDAKSQYRNQLDLVFEQFDDFQPEGLKPLLQRLRGKDRVSSK